MTSVQLHRLAVVILGLTLVAGAPLPATPRARLAPCVPGAERTAVVGQTLYVPAYPEIPYLDATRRYPLTVTLSIRNTNVTQPISVTSVRYHDTSGHFLRAEVEQPLRLGPLAATVLVVEERDTRGGAGASFLVEWRAERPVQAPVVETIMIGTTGTQGISFVSPGRVLRTRCP